MLPIVRSGLVAVMFSLLVGCAGKDFVRPSSDTFKLGQTTYSQVIQQMGEPSKTGAVLMNEKNVKVATYSYASMGGESFGENIVPGRALSCFFYNDVLVGQEFLSSFKSDNSNFDDSKISSISKGKTTRGEVIQLLGKPTATFVYPMAKKTSGEAFGYTYSVARIGVFNRLSLFTKSLRISFDNKDLVSEVDYAESGNK